MSVIITPPVEKLVHLFVQAYAESKNAALIVDHDLAREAAIAYADAIVIVLRGGVDASEGQMDEVAIATELLVALDEKWGALHASSSHDLERLVRDFQSLNQTVFDRLKQIVDVNETAAELLQFNAREREIRLNLARPIILKFAVAAYRWLGPDTSEMARFAAEQRADVLSDTLVHLLPADCCIDPMRTAQNVRNTARSEGRGFSGFSPNDIIERINEALK